MKKIVITTIAGLLTTMTLNAEDCIMAKDLNVQFINASTKYETQDEYTKIKEYAEFLKQTDLYAIIEGHTNHYAPARYNYELSQKRAEKVKAELITLGVESSKIKALAYGESKPLYDNNTSDGAEKNRRVTAEVFNTKESLNNYASTEAEQIAVKKFQEQ